MILNSILSSNVLRKRLGSVRLLIGDKSNFSSFQLWVQDKKTNGNGSSSRFALEPIEG